MSLIFSFAWVLLKFCFVCIMIFFKFVCRNNSLYQLMVCGDLYDNKYSPTCIKQPKGQSKSACLRQVLA